MNKQHLPIHIFLIFVVLLFARCGKEFSYEGGAGGAIAVYTLNQDAGICTNPVVSGDYFPGIPLDGKNTIQVMASVSAVGSYIISTSSANGFQFEAAGTFTETGTQLITMKGTGMPATSGSFDLSIYGISSCSFKVDVNQPIVEKAIYTFTGTTNACANAVVDTNYVADTALRSYNQVELSVNVIKIGLYDIHTDTVNGMSYSGRGTFTSTGNKKVVLGGSGTPKAFGKFYFTPIHDSLACSFAVNVKPHAASYVIESRVADITGTCIQGVSGDFKIGITLNDSTGFVSIKAFVITPGIYTISTKAVDGISFSATALFTTDGSQYVVLKGSGTPERSGNFTFTPSIIGLAPFGGASCDFVLTVQ